MPPLAPVPPIGRRRVLAGLTGLSTVPPLGAAWAAGGTVPVTPPIGTLELARAVAAPSAPTGVAVSADGQMFVFMPRFDAALPFSIGRVGADGDVAPWPDAAINRPDPQRPRNTLFFIPNGVFDGQNRLWVLDAGLLANSAVPTPGAAKLLCFDIASGRVLATVALDAAVEPTSSLNDLRVDQAAKTAFISDQGQKGQGALVAVDLATGRAVRRLARHPSTASVPGILKIVEGQPVLRRSRDGATKAVQGGANPIALSPDGQSVYYGALIGRDLYRVPAAALLDAHADDAAVAATVTNLGEKGLTGGILADSRDRVYLALQELNAVGRRWPDGRIEVLATDPRLIWPDTFWITPDRWLYVSSSQVNRRPDFNGGIDKVEPPFAVLRLRIDAGPA